MLRSWIVLLALLFGTDFAGSAQSRQTGLYSFAPFESLQFDSINLSNLNIHFTIPVVSKKGRGQDFTYVLSYDGLVWSPVSSPGGSTSIWTHAPYYGFTGMTGEGNKGLVSWDYTVNSYCTNTSDFSFHKYNFFYLDPGGSKHYFNYTEDNDCNSVITSTGDGSSADGSGYTFSNNVVTSPDGFQISAMSLANHGSVTDRNGNVISDVLNETFTDTTGQNILSITGNGTSNSPKLFTYPVSLQGNAATAASVSVYYSSYTVQTNFGCSGITDAGAGPEYLIDHIVLPDASGSTYRFTYEATPGGTSGAVTGRLASVTLPSGGTIAYSYSGGCGHGINSDGSLATLVRSTTDGIKTYTHLFEAGSAISDTQTVDEAGNGTSYTFVNSTNGLSYEVERQVYDGPLSSGTPLLDRTTLLNGQSGFSEITGAPIRTDVFEIYNWLNSNANADPNKGQLRTSNVYTSNGLLQSSVQYNTAAGTIPIASTQYGYNTFGEVTSAIHYDSTGNLTDSTTYGYDESGLSSTSGLPQHTVVSGRRGNQTSSHTTITSNRTIDTASSYDDAGQVLAVTTPTGTSSVNYDSTDTFPVKVTLPALGTSPSMSSSAAFDSQSGLQISQTGLNAGQTTTFQQYDALLRPVVVTYAQSGAQTNTVYAPNQMTVSSHIDGSTSTTQTTQFDGYGRVKRTAVWNGTTYYVTDACYGSTGLVAYVGTPYTSSSLTASQNCGNGDSFTYDALGRMLGASHADGSATTWTYYSRAIRQVNTPGTSKITQSDLIGRVTGICEISTNTSMPQSGGPTSCGMNIAGSGFVTSFAYDMANHKTTVIQGAQQRVFQTDMAGRPILATEPERGTTTYSYNYNTIGLQVVRTRGRANQSSASVKTTTTTQYDRLSRPISVVYSDGTPTKTFNYDEPGNGGSVPSQLYPLGQLTSMNNGSHAETFVYDIMGRLSETVECLPDWCGDYRHDVFRFYGYNYLGQLTTDRYATSGNGQSYATVNYAYNQAKQLLSIAGGQNGEANAPVLYTATADSMLPFGPQTASFGNSTGAFYRYDTRGRRVGQWICGGSTPPAEECPGNSYSYGYLLQRTGDYVNSVSDNITNRNTNFSFDEFGRLSGGTPIGQSPGFTMSEIYDRYGNRWNETVNNPNGPSPSTSFTYDPATNHNTTAGFSYDATGNLLTDGVHSYSYDAEGQLLSVDGGATASYVYNALNLRSKTVSGGATDRYGYDAQGHRSTIWLDGSTSLKSAHYLGPDGPIAEWIAADGITRWEYQDQVGTERLRLPSTGSSLEAFGSLPFGQSINVVGTDTSPYHFAGLDEDGSLSTGLSHASFRDYSSVQARWMNPDPYDGSYNLSDPQSLNRYAYVENNPLFASDPSGQDMIDIFTGEGGGGGGGGDSIYVGDGGSVTVTASPFDPVDPYGPFPGGCVFGCGTIQPVQPISPPQKPPSKPTPTPTPTPAPMPPSKPVVLQNPCSVQGRALTPSAYVATGQQANGSPVNFALDVGMGWFKNHYLDAQPLASGNVFQKQAYGNYVFGAYMAAAGVSLNTALVGASTLAFGSGAYSTYTRNGFQMDQNYPLLPAANIGNIANGFNAAANGTVCH